jgi:hypothetical protein
MRREGSMPRACSPRLRLTAPPCAGRCCKRRCKWCCVAPPGSGKDRRRRRRD